MFELFVQGAQGIHRPQGGLGLGLTIARNLARLHGGSLSASSRGPGSGSEFLLRLPLSNTPAGDVREPAHHGAVSAPRKRVLLVDDNEDATTALSELLRVMGYDVIAAADGPSALQLLATHRVDVALLDIGLPVMDGYELARHIRQSDSDGEIRLVALTGYGQPNDRERSEENGFSHHLVKPVDMVALVRALQ